MFKRIVVALGIVVIAAVVGQPQSASASKSFDKSACTFGGRKLSGRIQVVTSSPDVRVQVVTSSPDVRVQVVTSSPNSCGRWQMVTSSPNTRVQFVTSSPDVRIQYVTSSPGAR
jgi:hypothetical protein